MKKIYLLILLLVFSASAFAQGGVRVEAPSLVGVGEQFNVSVRVDASDSPSEVQWNIGDDFQLVWGPQKTGTSKSISIVNGKRSSSYSVTYKYILLARNKGVFTLPPVTAVCGSQTLRSSPVRIEVVTDGAAASQSPSGEEQPQTPAADSRDGSVENFLRFSISKKEVYVGEPITATLKLYTRAQIAGFEDAKLPTFNGFWSQETYAPSNIEFRSEKLNDKIYQTAVWREYTLIPQQTGDVKIDPAEITLVANVRVAPSGMGSIFDSFFEDIRQVQKKAVSPGYTVRVNPLPAGAPDSFGGGVGKFSISLEPASVNLKTHQASSLKITVSGDGNIALLQAPKPELPSDFEVYDVTETESLDASKMSGSKTFEYPFIPRSYGDFTIPPLKYSYFDSSDGKYYTLQTEPVKLHVAKSAAGDSPGGDALMVGASNGKSVKNLGTDIRYISTRMPDFKARDSFFVLSAAFFAVLSFILLFSLAVFLVYRKAAADRADVAGSRNRRAAKMARKRLASAGEYLSKDLQGAFYEEMHRALLGFASDKLNMPLSSLSKENISATMVEKGVSAEYADSFASLLDACEYARYAPGGGHEQMDAHYSSALELISNIDSQMKRLPKASSSAALSLLVALGMMAGTQAGAQNTDPSQQWNSATEAYAASDWDAAIQNYKEIEGSGLEAPSLYYNLGNAYFRRGDLGLSILYYERALKLDPSYADARHNLEFANTRIQDRIDTVPPFFLKSWMDSFRRILPSNAWAWICIVLLALALCSLLLFLLGKTPAGKKTGFGLGVAMLLLSVMCFAFSLSLKSAYENSGAAIVTAAVSQAYSSPAEEGSSTLFVLHEGTKVQVLDSIGKWTNVKLADGRQGWLGSDSIELI